MRLTPSLTLTLVSEVSIMWQVGIIFMSIGTSIHSTTRSNSNSSRESHSSSDIQWHVLWCDSHLWHVCQVYQVFLYQINTAIQDQLWAFQSYQYHPIWIRGCWGTATCMLVCEYWDRKIPAKSGVRFNYHNMRKINAIPSIVVPLFHLPWQLRKWQNTSKNAMKSNLLWSGSPNWNLFASLRRNCWSEFSHSTINRFLCS